MNDELPTDERLRRIERAVERRIGARRVVAQTVARGAAAVLLVVLVLGGGFLLLRSHNTAVSTAAAGSAASSAASASAVPIECDGARAVRTTADPSGLPASALSACARAERGGTTSAQRADGAPAASPSPAATRTLCRATDGTLHVVQGLPSACAVRGMRPFQR